MGKKIDEMKEIVLWFTKKYDEDNVSAHSAQVAFFIMVSFFPLLLFLLTLVSHTPLTQDMIFTVLDRALPSAFKDMISPWITEIFEKTSGTVISLSLISALWAGSKGFLGIIAGIQKIYDVEEKRQYFHVRFLAIFYTIIFSLMIIVSMAVLVYGNKIFLLIESFIFNGRQSLSNLLSFRAVFGLALFILFFAMLYKFVPNRKLRFRDQLAGAFLSAVLWVAFSYIYSIYIDYFAQPATLYGSLAYIVLFMLWLYVCSNIIFVGALTNNFIATYKKKT